MKRSATLFFFLWIWSLVSHGQTSTWTNGNANNSWNDAGNWSSGIPGSGVTAVFDATSTADCNFDANVDVAGFDVSSAYTGTLTQNSGITITIGSSGATFSGGTFSGGDASITSSGALTISGTAFTSTSGSLNLNHDYTLSSGSFTHNSGTVVFGSSDRTISGSQTFNNMTITHTSNGSFNVATGTVLTVSGTFTLSGTRRTDINDGTISAQGNVSITNTNTGNAGSGTFEIGGSANQAISSTSTIGQGELPSVVINKAGGTATFSGILSIEDNWTYTTGTTDFNTNGATVAFTATDQTITGSQVFENLTIAFSNGGDLDVTNNITVNGTFSITGSSKLDLDGPGEVQCAGDISITQTSLANAGTGTITINGNGAQAITSTVAQDQGELPNVIINKSGGTATFNGIFTVRENWTYTAGTTDFSTNNATVVFNTSDYTITGNQVFENLTLSFSSGGDFDVLNTVTVNGTFTIEGSSKINIDGPGGIECAGDVNLTQTNTNNSGDGTITINGTGAQAITSSVTAGQAELSNVVINKASGTATFSGVFTVRNSWTYTAGTTDFSTNGATVFFNVNNAVVNGNQIFEHVTVNFNSGGDFDVEDTITIGGTFTLEGTSRIDIDGPGEIHCTGDLTITQTSTSNGGNGTIVIDGTGAQAITSSVSQGQGELPSVVINKSGGTATFSGLLSIEDDWTYTAGTTDFSTNNATVSFTSLNQVITGSQVFENLVADLSGNGDLDITNDITINGTFTIEGSSRTDIDGPGVIQCTGDLVITNSNGDGNGDGTITINGTGAQAITVSSSIGTGEVPSVVINKASGTATFSGILSVEDNWTYTAGTTDFSTNNATVAFTGNNQVITGSQTFENLTAQFSTKGDLDLTNDITVNGTFTLAGSNRTDIDGPGIVQCAGDIAITNTSGGCAGNGTVTINGNGAQAISSSVAGGLGELPSVIMNKSGGTATFSGIVSVEDDWTYTAGTMDFSTNNATLYFGDQNQTITGTQAFENLTFSLTSTGDVILANDVTVAGTFTLAGSRGTDIDGPGSLLCTGDISISNTSSSNNGNATVSISGTGAQAISSSSSLGQGELPSVEINKSSGTATFSGILSVEDNWTYTAGTVDFNTNSATIAFTSTNQVISGEQTFYNLTASLSNNGDLDISNNINVAGTFTLGGTNRTDLDGPGEIRCQGNIVLDNTSSANDGDGTVRVNGTGSQSLTSSAGVGECELPHFIIDKSSGTLTMSDTISIRGDWTYSNGTVDLTTNSTTVAFTKGGNIDAEAASTLTFYNLEFTANNQSTTLQGNLTVSNILTLGSQRVTLNGNTLSLTNNSLGALDNTSGRIISESTDNSGIVSWNVGSVTGSYVIPFYSSSGTSIPLTFQLTAGDAGTVSMSTYGTGADNTPFPTTPDAVTHLDNLGTGADNSANCVDRFWQIDKDGPSGTATITFTYANAERPANGETDLRAQRWATGSGWQTALAGQSSDASANTVTVSGVTEFSPWTLSLDAQPLPIELVNFDAYWEGDKVRLWWSTATEINNDYFTIERSSDGRSFAPLFTRKGAGHSAEKRDYEEIDSNPSAGVNYYRLKQTDFDGVFSYSPLAVVNPIFSKKSSFQLFPNPTSGPLTLSGGTIVGIELVNTSGERIPVSFVQGTDPSSYQVQLGNLVPGYYTLLIQTPHRVERMPLVVR